MEESRLNFQISKRNFISSASILFILMITSGIITRIIPNGTFERKVVDGREIIIPTSFSFIEGEKLPIYKWFTAPIDVLFSSDGLMIIAIILFILIIGGTFNVLEKSSIIKHMIGLIVKKFGKHKYFLLATMIFCFMLFGAVLGIFEEMVVIVPISIALAHSLGWDSLVGLGMSILATGFGFSAAIFNPFTIGVAQRIAGLPLFSGAGLRILIFLTVYVILALFLLKYARLIEESPEKSIVFQEDRISKEKYKDYLQDEVFIISIKDIKLNKALKIFGIFMIFIVITLIISPFIAFLSSYSLPLVALLFLIAGITSGLVSGLNIKMVMSLLFSGILGITPGIILILMATSVKHIITQGKVMDTILYYLSLFISSNGKVFTAFFIYVSVLILNFFIGSGSAKAFLVIPIITPLAEIVGITRQCAVQAFCFGDGFSNMLYPTNAVLLISLGLSGISYTKWFKWTIWLQIVVLVMTLIFLTLAVKLNYGPF